jgi:NAD(P)-dependent dehydrogenase (short-subunit alcohol dehydrogenase family)
MIVTVKGSKCEDVRMLGSHKPNFSLSGKVVMVTGASRGIGKAVAEACAASGADLILGVRRESDVAGLVHAAKVAGRRALAVTIDLPNLDQARASITSAHSEMGCIDVLVNNVGIGPENLAENVTEADFDITVDVNLKGTFFLSQAVAKLMKEQGGGRIINISSQAGSVVLKGEAIYCMSKAAINHLTRCLAYEWAPYHINVNSVSPTFIRTDGTAPALSDPAFHAHVLAHIPLGRIGQTADVAGTVVFLASPAAELITGTNLMVDGGWSVAA